MSKKNILDYVSKDTKEQFKELLEVDFDIEKLTGSKLMKVNQVNYVFSKRKKCISFRFIWALF